jgi:quinol monooxygenase YgiN
MTTKPVYTYAQWKVKDGQLDAVLAILTEVTQKSTEEKGNLFYKVHQSNSDSNILILFEGYANEIAAEAHRSSNHFQNLVIGQIIPLLDQREVIQMSQIL